MPRQNLTDMLLYSFMQTLRVFDVEEIAATNAFNYLVDAYSTGDRTYHTLKHIHHVLSTIDILQAYAQDLTAVQLAAWFHDVIYHSQAKDNEEKSAEYAEELLSGLGIPINHITNVKRLILQTKYHQAAEDDIDSQVLLDADLAILAASPDEYREYADGIRQEYAWVSQAEYIMGRRQILERFLQRDCIYFTPLMFDMAEQSARRNLRGEIHSLSNHSG